MMTTAQILAAIAAAAVVFTCGVAVGYLIRSAVAYAEARRAARGAMPSPRHAVAVPPCQWREHQFEKKMRDEK